MNRPTVSIVIETSNWADEHSVSPTEALGSVLGQTYPAELLDVVVVLDVRSQMHAAAVSKVLPRARVVTAGNEELGYFQMKDRGIRAAEGNLVALWDSDVVYSPEWIERVVRCFEGAGDEVAAVAGLPRIETEDGRLHPLSFLLFLGPYRGRSELKNFSANSIAFLRDRYLASPFADVPARLGVEWSMLDEWSRRGWRLILEPSATAMHARPSNVWKRLVFNGNAQAEGRTALGEYGRVAYWRAAARQGVRWALGGAATIVSEGPAALYGTRDYASAAWTISMVVPAYLYGTYCHSRGISVSED